MSLIVESVAKILDDAELNDAAMYKGGKGGPPYQDFKTGPPSEVHNYMHEQN